MSKSPHRYRLVAPLRAVGLEVLGVLAFFTAVAVFATWPLARHPLGGFYGFGNDNWGGIWVFGWLHDAYLNPASAGFSPDLQAPFGYDIPEQALQPLDRLVSLALGGPGQGLGAYNAQIFASFVLAGCTMYLLAKYLTGSRLAALVAGFAFTFSPFHLAMAMQYNALASIEWVPLYVLALLVVLRTGRLRDAVLAGAAFALVAFTSYYYAWFLIWFTLAVGAALAVRLAWRRRRDGQLCRSAARRFVRLALTRGAAGTAVPLLLSGPFLVPSLRGVSARSALEAGHPLTEGIRYAARPWMFFVPPHDNPIVGDAVSSWVTRHLYDCPVYEQAVYLGYTLLVLAGIACWRRGSRLGVLPERARHARPLLMVGALSGLAITLGPYLPLDQSYWRLWSDPEATRHLPSIGFVMFKLAPIFRFFSRAYVLVSVCLAALAAIGISRVEQRLGPSPVRRGSLALALLALIGLEFSNAPPHVWYSAARPPWVTAVRKLPPGSVIDYPLAPANSPRSLYYMFWQREHQHATLNPTVSSEAEQLAAAVASPDDVRAGRVLHDVGIDYAVVHTKLPPQTTLSYQPGLPDDSMPRDAGLINPWFRLVRRTPDAVIYRIRNAPSKSGGAVARPGEGFGPAEPEPGGTARWLERKSGTVVLTVTGARRPLAAALTLLSFARPRQVSVSLDGQRLEVFEVPVTYQTRRIVFGPLSAGPHVLRLVGTPGPQSIQAATGIPDPRSVSLRLREPVLVMPAKRR